MFHQTRALIVDLVKFATWQGARTFLEVRARPGWIELLMFSLWCLVYAEKVSVVCVNGLELCGAFIVWYVE